MDTHILNVHCSWVVANMQIIVSDCWKLSINSFHFGRKNIKCGMNHLWDSSFLIVIYLAWILRMKLVFLLSFWLRVTVFVFVVFRSLFFFLQRVIEEFVHMVSLQHWYWCTSIKEMTSDRKSCFKEAQTITNHASWKILFLIVNASKCKLCKEIELAKLCDYLERLSFYLLLILLVH